MGALQQDARIGPCLVRQQAPLPLLRRRQLQGARVAVRPTVASASAPAPKTAAVRAAVCRNNASQQVPSRRRDVAAAAGAGGAAVPMGGSGDAGDAGAGGSPEWERRLARALKIGTNLFPLWTMLAAVAGFYHPPLFTWFRDSYITASLMAVMLAMGLTLTFREMGAVFTRQPGLLLLGMALQYSVLPAVGWGISKWWGLPSSLAVGVALVSCMPGGTASNIVAYIARGDMPLSLMMTTASTLMAVFTTPLLTSLLVGTLVPVDARAMFLSTLQLVLVPVLLGALINQLAPRAVSRLRAYTPFLATVIVVLIVGSMISTNVAVVARSGALRGRQRERARRGKREREGDRAQDRRPRSPPCRVPSLAPNTTPPTPSLPPPSTHSIPTHHLLHTTAAAQAGRS